MKQVKLGMLLSVLCLMSVSASADVIFSDDFSGDLSQWTVNGPSGGLPYTNGSELDFKPSVAGEPWESSVTSVGQWTTPGLYELEVDIAQGHQEWTYEKIRVTMPGGLVMGFKDWNNGANIYYNGSLIGTVGSAWYAWKNYKMVLDGQHVSVYVDGTLALDQEMSTAPDFTTYNQISLWSKFGVDVALVDKVTLSYTPEPATMSLLAAGGFLILRRRRA